MSKVLIIDDDEKYGQILADMLSTHDYDVDYCRSSEEALNLLSNNKYDLLLLDLYLGNDLGVDLAQKIRSEDPEAKIIILTNSAEDKDEVHALKNSVNDYVRKEVSYGVMIERIKRVLSQNAEFSKNVYIIKNDDNNIKVDMKNEMVTIDGKVIHLTQLEIDLLVYFIKNKNKVLSREEILREVWKLPDQELLVDTRTIDVHVKNLRKKLNIKSIYSIRGLGYRWYD